MAHDHHHHHSHDDRNAYYLNQLFTIGVCGAIGAVAVMLWWTRTIRFMLHEKFWPWVLAGGIALLVLVILRAVAVWRSVDEPVLVPEGHEDCGHDHGECGHDHGIRSQTQTTGISAGVSSLPLVPPHPHDHDHHHHHGHDHDHGHDHGWAPWRYVVLLLPVVLYFLNLPNKGFSADVGGDPWSGVALSAPEAVRYTGTESVSFVQLQSLAATQESREYYEGKTVTLTGQYYGNDPRRFSLKVFKIACCGADAVPLNALIMVDRNSTEIVDPDRYRSKWVEVTGRIQFLPKPGTNESMTALILCPTKEEPITQFVKIIPPPPTPYVY